MNAPRTRTVRGVLAPILAAGLLGGCITGDFGRPSPSLIGERPHDWIGAQAAAHAGAPASRFVLTDDERTLRDLAYPLIAPPYPRQRWLSILAERGLIQTPPPDGAVDAAGYWTRLVAKPHRSPASRYARVIDDSRSDVARVDAFFDVARRVADMDFKREQSLSFIATTTDEREDAINRVNENGLVIAWVCTAVASRIVAYRFALERLVVAAPSERAADAERAVNLLQMRAERCQAPLVAQTVADAAPPISK